MQVFINFFLYKREPQNNLIWKIIPDYENYEISNAGLLKNIKFGKMKKLIEIPMKPFI
jgi:hypothetical protein